jgi:hypothetical protein
MVIARSFLRVDVLVQCLRESVAIELQALEIQFVSAYPCRRYASAASARAYQEQCGGCRASAREIQKRTAE